MSWVRSGDADWLGQTETYFYDGDSAQSGEITDSQISSLSAIIVGPGVLKFYWKASSQVDADYLTFYIDNVETDKISGDVDWNQKILK